MIETQDADFISLIDDLEALRGVRPTDADEGVLRLAFERGKNVALREAVAMLNQAKETKGSE